MNFEQEIEDSVSYLSSDRALKNLGVDAYWPKWNSPWWYMLLLHEMGETQQIPERAIQKYVEAQGRMPLKIFPIHPGEMPPGIDPYRETPCHCQLGNAYQVLSAWGLDVDRELPWIRPWFLKYQMADGGMNCDNSAYLVSNECPSSIVGTIAAFEALVLHSPKGWSEAEENFVSQGAKFLMSRKLKNGSQSMHNASERVSAELWTKLCFPRFYFYDVLRGLCALLAWSEKTGEVIPVDCIRDVVSALDARFPNGDVRCERLSFDGTTTLLPTSTGEWIRRQPATLFPLLEKVSKVGEVSPFLSQQWARAKVLLTKSEKSREILI